MDTLRDAAFGATPGAAAFAMSGAPGGRAPAALRDRWLTGVVLGGQGHYAAAASVLRSLTAGRRPLWAALAAGALASHRRQLGAHAAARRLDAAALAASASAATAPHTLIADGLIADGVSVAGARLDALLGLAADAIGLGHLGEAARLVAAAQRAAQPYLAHSAAPPDHGWRGAVRLGWVRAELALATGDPHAALDHAASAVRRSERAGAVRHQVKSRLVLAAAEHTAGHRDTAIELLHGVARDAAAHRLAPLRWPAELLLGELLGAGEHGARHRRAAHSSLLLVSGRADVALRTAAESSLWVPSEMLRSGDSAERSSAGEIHDEICTGLCQGSAPRDR